ncbi:hypothetical protein X726_04010 [Mesorhizobium sp. L103C105A0]|nr:hypothetical protein X726_04010 [Mesorhizobium sp. L103C105A0]
MQHPAATAGAKHRCLLHKSVLLDDVDDLAPEFPRERFLDDQSAVRSMEPPIEAGSRPPQ